MKKVRVTVELDDASIKKLDQLRDALNRQLERDFPGLSDTMRKFPSTRKFRYHRGDALRHVMKSYRIEELVKREIESSLTVQTMIEEIEQEEANHGESAQ